MSSKFRKRNNVSFERKNRNSNNKVVKNNESINNQNKKIENNQKPQNKINSVIKNQSTNHKKINLIIIEIIVLLAVFLFLQNSNVNVTHGVTETSTSSAASIEDDELDVIKKLGILTEFVDGDGNIVYGGYTENLSTYTPVYLKVTNPSSMNATISFEWKGSDVNVNANLSESYSLKAGETKIISTPINYSFNGAPTGNTSKSVDLVTYYRYDNFFENNTDTKTAFSNTLPFTVYYRPKPSVQGDERFLWRNKNVSLANINTYYKEELLKDDKSFYYTSSNNQGSKSTEYTVNMYINSSSFSGILSDDYFRTYQRQGDSTKDITHNGDMNITISDGTCDVSRESNYKVTCSYGNNKSLSFYAWHKEGLLNGNLANNTDDDDYVSYSTLEGDIPDGKNGPVKITITVPIGAKNTFGTNDGTFTFVYNIYSYTDQDKANLYNALNKYRVDAFASETALSNYYTALKKGYEVLNSTVSTTKDYNDATTDINNAYKALLESMIDSKYIAKVVHNDIKNDKSHIEYRVYSSPSGIIPYYSSYVDTNFNNEQRKTRLYDASNLDSHKTITYNYWYIDFSGLERKIEEAEGFIENEIAYDGPIDDLKSKVGEANNYIETYRDDDSINTYLPENEDDINDLIDEIQEIIDQIALKQFTITFNNYDGTKIFSDSFEYGTTPECKECEPKKESTAEYDYEFNGWDPEIEEVTGEKTYTATYKEIKRKYIIHFVNDDDSLLFEKEYEYGETPECEDCNPKKESTVEYDYDFDKWDKEIKEVTSEETYKAVYKATKRKYLIKFINDDDSLFFEKEFEYGTEPKCESCSLVKDSTPEFDYEFAGWNEQIQNVTGPKTYKATYKEIKRKYLIKFKIDDEVIFEKAFEYGSLPECEECNLTKESTAQYDYEFSGWDEEIEVVTGAKTYKAQFTSKIRSYKIIFVDDEDKEIFSKTYEYGETPECEECNLTKESTAEYDYEFDKWDKEIKEVTGEETYKAVYKAIKRKYLIKFINDDDSLLFEKEFEYGTTPKCEECNPTKESTAEYDYEFNGWDEKIESVTGTKTYKATYKSIKRKYLIKFKVEDKVIFEKEYEYGETPVCEECNLTKESTAQYDYEFSGWDEEIEVVTGAKTYKGEFISKIRSYKITFVDDEDKEIFSKTYEYGETPECEECNLTKESTAEYDYEFDKWDKEIKEVTGEETYKAIYKATKRKYLIKFINDDDSLLFEKEFEYGTTPKCEECNPTKESTAEYDYEFNGWDEKIESVTGTKTYKATYKSIKRKYLIKFKVEDKVIFEKEYEYGETPVCEECNLTKESTAQYDYEFSGWDEEIEVVTGAKTYKGEFISKIRSYKITFVDDEDKEIFSKTYEYGETPECEECNLAKESTAQYDYEYIGWDKEIKEVTGEETYKAKYLKKIKQYQITFKNSDGTILQTIIYDYGEKPKYTGSTPQIPPTSELVYEFEKWDCEIENVTENKTYIAVYKTSSRKYKINFVDDEGNIIETQECEYNELPSDVEIPQKEPTAEYEYIIIGWNKEISKTDSETTYIAQYKKVKRNYVVTFKNDNDEVISQIILEYGTIPKYEGSIPTKKDDDNNSYKFIGWDKEFSELTENTTYIAKYKKIPKEKKKDSSTTSDEKQNKIDEESKKIEEEPKGEGKFIHGYIPLWWIIPLLLLFILIIILIWYRYKKYHQKLKETKKSS